MSNFTSFEKENPTLGIAVTRRKGVYLSTLPNFFGLFTNLDPSYGLTSVASRFTKNAFCSLEISKGNVQGKSCGGTSAGSVVAAQVVICGGHLLPNKFMK